MKIFRKRQVLSSVIFVVKLLTRILQAKYDTLISLEESKIKILNQKKQCLELEHTKKRNEIMFKIVSLIISHLVMKCLLNFEYLFLFLQKRAEEIILQKRNEMKYQISNKLRT